MKKTKKIALIFIIIVFSIWIMLSSAVTIFRILDIKNESKRDKYIYENERNESLQGYNYSKYIGLDLDQKIRAADSNFVRLQSAKNDLNNINANVKSYIPSASVIDSFKILYTRWPDFLKDFVRYHILSVVIVENLGSSGVTWAIRDGQNQDFILGIDKSVFVLTPNTWATNKDLSVFCDNVNLSVEIEEDSTNFVSRSLEMILLHEIGHAYGVAKGHIPLWYSSIYPSGNNNCFPFLSDAFFINSYETKRKMPLFNIFDSLSFYNTHRSSCRKVTEIDSIFKLLAKSPYPTLYSSQNAEEYYAEAFASYIHCIIQDRKYEIHIGNKVYKNGITEDRCKTIREFFKTELKCVP